MSSVADVSILEFLAIGGQITVNQTTNEITVNSDFPNIDVEVNIPSSSRITEIITPGVQGIQGVPGPPGPPGIPGSAVKYSGEGPPGTIIGAAPGDRYLDTITGTVYRLD